MLLGSSCNNKNRKSLLPFPCIGRENSFSIESYCGYICISFRDWDECTSPIRSSAMICMYVEQHHQDIEAHPNPLKAPTLRPRVLDQDSAICYFIRQMDGLCIKWIKQFEAHGVPL